MCVRVGVPMGLLLTVESIGAGAHADGDFQIRSPIERCCKLLKMRFACRVIALSIALKPYRECNRLCNRSVSD